MKLFNNKKLVPNRQPKLTPASNKSLYSYHHKRAERSNQLNRDPEAVEKGHEVRNKKKLVQHIPLLFLVITIIIGVLYLSTVDVNVKVISKGDKSTALRDLNIYQESAQKLVSKSILNRSKLLFDSQALISEFKQQFPEISAVTVTVPIMGRRPILYIQTTKPSFILTSNNNSYLVGSNGKVLLSTQDVNNLDTYNLRTVHDESGINVQPGKSALPQQQAIFISMVIEQLEKQGFKIEYLTIPTSPYDLYVRLVGTPYVVKLNILEDPKQQVGSFIALKNKLDSEKIVPKEYIDVRVGERVFYK